ncbi:MAG: MFS transporter [Alphaproteobacteria bacterium]|nr:MFS transporter [Alphaproteobacteria bacterium]
MLVLIATLAIQALATLMVLAPPVFAGLAAPDFGISANHIGVFTAVVYAAAVLSTGMSGGPVRRYGAIRVSQAALLIGAAGLALLASASIWLGLIGAVFIGVGYGPMTPASSHLLIRQTPPARRALVFSIKQTGVPLGGALAGLVVPPLAIPFGWRGAALAVAAVSALLAIVCEPLHKSLDDDADPKAAGGSHIVAAVNMVLGEPVLRRLALASLSYSAMQLCVSAFVVNFLTERAGMALVAAGVVMAVLQAAGIVGRVLWGWTADRLLSARRALSLLGLTIGAAGAVLALIGPGWPFALVLAVAAALGAVALGWNGVFLAEVARLAPAGSAGMATGGALALTFVGALLGPPLFGAIIDMTGSYRVAFFVVAAAAALSGIAVRPRTR